MSTAMNFGSKSFRPRPPDKGAFPLDHFGKSDRAHAASRHNQWLCIHVLKWYFVSTGECKSFKETYMRCLRESHFDNSRCREESKEYLECRMDRCCCCCCCTWCKVVQLQIHPKLLINVLFISQTVNGKGTLWKTWL